MGNSILPLRGHYLKYTALDSTNLWPLSSVTVIILKEKCGTRIFASFASDIS
jgi:hypothetical protein